jgi:hypothetical protein
MPCHCACHSLALTSFHNLYAQSYEHLDFRSLQMGGEAGAAALAGGDAPSSEDEDEDPEMSDDEDADDDEAQVGIFDICTTAQPCWRLLFFFILTSRMSRHLFSRSLQVAHAKAAVSSMKTDFGGASGSSSDPTDAFMKSLKMEDYDNEDDGACVRFRHFIVAVCFRIDDGIR